ncbi:hypothetical protein FQZ97_1101020 [compost metagenome]
MRIIEPGLQCLRFGFLQIIDLRAVPASKIAIPQRLDNLHITAEQPGGLPCSTFRSAEQPRRPLEPGTKGALCRLPIHLNRLIRRKTRQFLCDGSSVAHQGQTGCLHERSLGLRKRKRRQATIQA